VRLLVGVHIRVDFGIAGKVRRVGSHFAVLEELLVHALILTAVVRQIVVPYIKGTSSCLAQALRFGIAG
jgi:hypothetical protein